MANAEDDRALARTILFMIGLLAGFALFATACRIANDDVSLAQGDRNGASATTDVESTTPQPDGAAESAENDEDEVLGTDMSASPEERPAVPLADLPRAITVADIDCVAAEQGTNLTAVGETMFARHVAAGAEVPEYQLVVDVDPSTGRLAGALRAVVPAQDRSINFRVFAGMDAFNANLDIRNVAVNGEPADANLDRSLLTIPAPRTGEATIVELDFSFTVDQMAANENLLAALSGESLQPDQVGLLGRTDTGMQLGHWFPIWLPDGIRTDPDPSGFGDIGAFPAASICATITVPSGYEVVTGGTRLATTETSIIEGGTGLRDLSMLISDDLQLAAGVAYGVEIRVWGPSGNPESLIEVLDYAVPAHTALTEAFGPYPWKEVDIIAAPLGAGVGGMEWPGAIWIEQNLFAGGLPGMGDLGAALGDERFDSLLGAMGGPAITTSLEWTIAHELGHEWWHANVGNDSIASPAIDEPLAQFAACIAIQTIHPDNWREICEAQTIDQFSQARALGIADTAAEQATDKFDSSLQYGAVVYGKAPGFYLAAADLLGFEALTSSLRSFIAEHSFDLVSTDTLRSHLIAEAGDAGPEIGALWNRWFREAKGDDDIEASSLLDDLDLEGFENLDLDGLDLENLDLDGLDLENLDLEELFQGLDLDKLLQGSGLEDLDIDDLLQELLEATAGGG